MNIVFESYFSQVLRFLRICTSNLKFDSAVCIRCGSHALQGSALKVSFYAHFAANRAKPTFENFMARRIAQVMGAQFLILETQRM